MKFIARSLCAFVLLYFMAPPAFADEASDLAAMKAQLNTLDHEYDGKIRPLESRLEKAEAEAKRRVRPQRPLINPPPRLRPRLNRQH